MRAAVFLGYFLNPGSDWGHQCVYASFVSDFVGQNLHVRASNSMGRVHIQIVPEYLHLDAPDVYPLREAYLWFNTTYPGIMTAIAMEPDCVDNRALRDAAKKGRRDKALLQPEAIQELGDLVETQRDMASEQRSKIVAAIKAEVLRTAVAEGIIEREVEQRRHRRWDFMT